MRSPRVDDWPEQWLVDIDRREATGDRSPLAVWWAQFFAWTRGGVVDEQVLADALGQLVEARQRAAEEQRRARMLQLLSEPPRRVDPWGDAPADHGLDIRVDGENPVGVTFGLDHATGPDATVIAAVERGPDGSLRTLSIGTPWSNDDLGARLITEHRSGHGRSARTWAQGRRVIDEAMYDATQPRSEWPFLDP